MDELAAVKAFRENIEAAEGAERAAALSRLEKAIDSGAIRPSGQAHRQRRFASPRPLAALLFAAAATVGLALLLMSPWSSNLGFVQRADAALRVDDGTVLHEKILFAEIDPSGKHVNAPPVELWAAGNGSFREFLPRRSGIEELGSGAPGSTVALTYDPAAATIQESCSGFGVQADPTVVLRKALTKGIVHDEGAATLGGRHLEKLGAVESGTIETFYVDPVTFFPIRSVSVAESAGRRTTSIATRVILETLPETAANLRLTDLAAAHPDATVVPSGLPCWG